MARRAAAERESLLEAMQWLCNALGTVLWVSTYLLVLSLRTRNTVCYVSVWNN